MILSLSIIGPDNQLLFLDALNQADQEALLKYNYLSHSSLDMIDSRLKAMKSQSTQTLNPDQYLGLLMFIEGVRIFAHYNNTHYKLLLITSELTNDSTATFVLKNVNSLLIQTIVNPFYKQGDALGESFKEQARAILESNSWVDKRSQ